MSDTEATHGEAGGAATATRGGVDGAAEGLVKGAEEAGQAFAKEFAVDVGAAEPAGDGEVMTAFALGWQMSELYKPRGWSERDAEPGPDLPGLGELGGRQRAQLELDQVSVALRKLATTISSAGLEVPNTKEAEEKLSDKPTADYEEAIFKLHIQMLTRLTAAHFKLGKAYGLGRALSDTARRARDIDTLKQELESGRVATVLHWLSDLTSLFPPHAGHVVADSLTSWRDWAASEGAAESDPAKALGLLRRQGQRWRSLLSGEKSATDNLTLGAYVNAGAEALSQTSTLGLSFLGRFKLAVTVALLLFAGGIALILVDPTNGHLAAGLAGILASLGLTWKGVGATLGTTAAKMERPVWEGALDTQIASTITRLPAGQQPKSRAPRLIGAFPLTSRPKRRGDRE